MKKIPKRKLLCVVMDGIGERNARFGNAVKCAHTPTMNWLRHQSFFTTLKAHGPYVGLPSDQDMGNSEVGHNAIGAGRVFDQGAKLVQNAIDSGALLRSDVWKQLVIRGANGGTLHFLGLLSDGNVHSHENHLYAMLRASREAGVKVVRVHVLLDGRDVGEKSAEIYVDRLERVLEELRLAGCDARVASGGGRMHITMDRYHADWAMVERGWQAHVLGVAPHSFPSLPKAIEEFRRDPHITDQHLPAFVIVDPKGKPLGTIQDGDGVVFFNFRGDRALEISKAFESDESFSCFDRKRVPKVFYAGMTQYDGDEHVPKHFLVSPPVIDHTLGEHMAALGVRQFACSETQKFGHVTYFWNGNRSGCFDPKLEEYLEIPSELTPFEERPWMKADEITNATLSRMISGSFDFGRINYANGDMVGHTGSFDASVLAVSAVDLMLNRLVWGAKKTGTILLITADHGNADEMFSGKEADFPEWETLGKRPTPKTSHTLAEVPCYIYDPMGVSGGSEASKAAKHQHESLGLTNLANTCLELMGLDSYSGFASSFLSNEDL